jgi:hypothetical protein
VSGFSHQRERTLTDDCRTDSTGRPRARSCRIPVSPFQGSGISVSYYDYAGGGEPVEGLIVGDRGRLRLTYQDAHQSLRFYDDDVRTVSVGDLGTIVTVTLVLTVDTGSTSFSLLIPQVLQFLPPAAIQTEGITTRHKLLPASFVGSQRETYTVTELSGTARSDPLAAEARACVSGVAMDCARARRSPASLLAYQSRLAWHG